MQYKFFKEVGLSNGFLSKDRSIGSKSLEKISFYFPQLSLEWVITGKGSMLLEAPPPEEPPSPLAEAERRATKTYKLLVQAKDEVANAEREAKKAYKLLAEAKEVYKLLAETRKMK